MKITILQHTKDSPPSFTSTWLEQNKVPFQLVQAFKGEKIPSVDEIDWLIVLGGGMNIDEDHKHPFLREEKKLVEQILKKEKTFLGLCLGGQMLARVMGAEVRKNSEWEVGWHPVQIENHRLGLKGRPVQEELFVFEFHQDTFDNPDKTISFARNSITPNQGFITSNGAAVATQFHPEADEVWVKDCSEDIDYPSGIFVQSPIEMLQLTEKYLAHQKKWFSDLMSSLHARTKACL